MTEEDEENFKNEKSCHICNKKYKINYNQHVRDHDYFTVKYMGSPYTKFTYQKKLLYFFITWEVMIVIS